MGFLNPEQKQKKQVLDFDYKVCSKELFLNQRIAQASASSESV